jgi:hypothetical protein
MAADPWFDWPCKTCGHWKNEHSYVPGDGHTECGVGDCDCASFVWDECKYCDLEVGYVCDVCDSLSRISRQQSQWVSEWPTLGDPVLPKETPS